MGHPGFDQFAKDGSGGLEFVSQAEHGRGNRSRFGAGQADYAYAAAAGRSGYGDYGVVEIHRKRWPTALVNVLINYEKLGSSFG